MSGLHLIKHLQENNPALTENGAAQFATISAKAYCPRQLDESVEPGDKEIQATPAGLAEAPATVGAAATVGPASIRPQAFTASTK